LIATEKRSAAGRRAGKLYYEIPMSSTAASASPNCINSMVLVSRDRQLLAGFRPTGFIYAYAREAPDFEAAKPPARDMLHVNIRRMISPSPRGSPSHVLFGRVLRCCPGFELPSRWCDNRIRTSHSSTLHTDGPFNLKG
jgi:hypothetical protein